MTYLENYFEKEMIVNRIRVQKADPQKKEIHVNRIGGKRVNDWIKIDNMKLFDVDGKPLNWSDIKDGDYYKIACTIPIAKISDKTEIVAKISEKMF